MIFSISSVALAATSLLSVLSTANAQASLQAAQYQGCYSTASPMYTNSSLTYQFQTAGWCQQQCGGWAQEPAFALTKGSDCWCGDKLPPNSTKVDDDECNRPCQGYGSQMCGGSSAFSVYTSGLTTTVEIASESEASAAATSATASSTAKSTSTQVQSTVTQAGQTIVVTATGAAASSTTTASSGGGASKGGIAAGVVVGIIVIAAIAAGAFFFIRHRKRRAIEEEHQRQQSINGLGRSGGTIMSEHSSADSRLDPTIMYRRQSDGSISDERDMSRRVLKVTNPDRNTMIA